MLKVISDFIVSIMDVVVGWLLYLPLDATLLIVALTTSALLTFSRALVTNQDLLRRCRADRIRLRELIKNAKKEKQKDEIKRYRLILGMVSMKVMKTEGKPLLVYLVPIAFLGVWAFTRLGYRPADPGKPIVVNAYFPKNAIGEITYLLPQPGLKICTSVITSVMEDKDKEGNVRNGIASWSIIPEKNKTPYALKVNFDSRVYESLLLADGGKKYVPPFKFFAGDNLLCIEVKLKELKLFGILPGIPQIGLPPWLLVYLVVAISCVPLLKKLAHIY